MAAGGEDRAGRGAAPSRAAAGAAGAGGAGAEEAAAAEWECNACTYLNNPLLGECEVGGTQRPLASLPEWMKEQMQQLRQQEEMEREPSR